MKINGLSKSVIDNVTYRPIHGDDRAKLLAFFDSLSDQTRRFFSPHPFSPETVDKILNGTLFPYLHIYFVAEKEDSIIGYAFLGLSRFRKILDRLNVRRAGLGIVVADSQQRENIGSEFLKYILGVARDELKLRQIVIFLYKDNTPAITFFEKHGFKIDKDVKDRASPRWMLHMSLDLLNKGAYMNNMTVRRQDSMRIAGSSFTYGKIIKSGKWVIKRLGLSGFLQRVAYSLSEKQPYFYDGYQKGSRLIEYAWALRNLGLEQGRILDVGCCGTLFPIMLASLGYEVVGVDLKDYDFGHPNFKFIKGDLLDPLTVAELGERKFDAITLISTIEHVGVELRTEDTIELDADSRLLSVLRNHLVSAGVMLITTEYGKPKVRRRPVDPSVDPPYLGKITPWYRLYNEEEIKRLAENAKLLVESKAYLSKMNTHWAPGGNAEMDK